MILKDKRLLACAMMVEGSFVCDIGTDHGYLPAYLISSGRCEGAIAADVNKKPLESAKAAFAAERLTDRAEFYLSDGLKDIPLESVTDVVIAGMGGELISRILSDKKAENGKLNFILQPMTKANLLRRFLAERGFEVKKETAVSEGKFSYAVMKCVFTGKPYAIDDVREYIGVMDMTEEFCAAYGRIQSARLKRAAEGMAESDPVQSQKLSETAENILMSIDKGAAR